MNPRAPSQMVREKIGKLAAAGQGPYVAPRASSAREDAARQVLLEALRDLHRSQTEMTGLLRGLLVNDVLGSETIKLDASGQASRSWAVPYAAVAVANHGNSELTVAAGALESEAPDWGRGVHRIGAGLAAVLALTGRELALYGQAAAAVTVTTFERPQPSAWGLVDPAQADETAGAFQATPGTLVAATVATVSLTGTVPRVTVWNRDGVAEIWGTFTGVAPTVAGPGTFLVPAAVGAVSIELPAAYRTAPAIKLISSGTPGYSVEAR